MAVYVIARHMSGGSGHEHVASVKWNNRADATSGKSTRAEMVKWIDGGGDARVAKAQSYVKVGVVDAIPKYIRTFADGVWTDNLLALPEILMPTVEEIRRQRIIDFVGQRIALVNPPRPYGSQQSWKVVGLVGLNGEQTWFSDAEALGAALADDVGFRAIELGTWLTTPDGSLIAESVGQIIPAAYRPEYQLVVDGLKFAADRQRGAGWQRALGVLAISFGLGFAVWLIGHD